MTRVASSGAQQSSDPLVSSNPTTSDTERKILRVATGESDYMANIGSLGDFILREELHGERRRRGMSPWEVRRRLALLEKGVILED